MTSLLEAGLSNLFGAGVLAVIAVSAGRLPRRPALSHALWLLVLIKLITPPLVPIPVPWLSSAEEKHEQTAAVVPPVEEPPLPARVAEPPTENQPQRLDADLPQTEPTVKPLTVAVPEPMPREITRRDVEKTESANDAALPAILSQPAPEARVDLAPPDDFPWPSWLSLIWLGGSLVWFGLAARRALCFHELLRRAGKANDALQAEVLMLAGRLGVRCPDVWMVPGTVSPMIWVWGRSCHLLLPERLIAALDAEKRAGILVHELAHLRRGDVWVRWLELIALGVYWWCPLAWWASRELREAEEECCDAWVLWALPGCARAYAHALVDTVDFLSEALPVLPPAASGLGPVHLLRRRLTMIMRGTTPRALTWVGAIAVVAFGVLVVPLVPSWAQPQPGSDPRPGALPGQQPAAQPTPVVAQSVDLEKAKQKLRAMQQDLEAKRADMERMARDIQKAMADLERAAAELAKKKQDAAKTAAKTPMYVPGPFKPGPIVPPDVDRRLRELEQKVDVILNEILALRRDMGGHKKADPSKAKPGLAPTPAVPAVPALPPKFVPGPLQKPPAPPLQGKVSAIKDHLVEIDIGKEHGLENGSTLEVYRLKPQPVYVGALRVVNLAPDRSVGEMLKTAPQREVNVGDGVTAAFPTRQGRPRE